MKVVTPALRLPLRFTRPTAVTLVETVVTVVLVGLLVAAHVGWRPGTMRLDAERETVVSTTPGTKSWEHGVRSGDRVVTLPGDTPSSPRLEVHLANGEVYGIIGLDPEPIGLVTFAIVGLIGLAAAGYASRERYWPGVAAIAAILSLNLTVPILGAVAAGPFATAAMYLAFRPHDRTSAQAMAAAVAGVLVWRLAIILSVSPWAFVTGVISLAVVAVVAKRTIGGLRRSWRSNASAPLRSRAGAVIDEILPGRTAARLRAAEEERAALADQIHASLLPDLERIIEGLDGGATREEIERLQAVRSELRDLMSERRLMLLEAFGLVPALEWLVAKYEPNGVEIELACAVEPDDPRPPREVELAAFRVAQQAIDNCLRHAGANRIEVLLEQADPEGCVLSVIDDGHGFDARRRNAAERSGHQGLLDMERRSSHIGGKCLITSAPNQGTEVSFRWSK